MLKYVAVFALVACVFSQDFDFAPPRPAPPRVKAEYNGPSKAPVTPTAILKQINRHNEDGSYTYGYESADGTFKIETKLPTGEVKGKYGYVDDVGKVRVIEYGATKHGFEPSGEGITVAPPTLVDETTNKEGNLLPEYSGAYYDQEDPAPAPAVRNYPSRAQQQQSIFDYSAPQTFEPASVPQRSPSPVPARAAIPGASQVQSSTFEFAPRASPARSYAPAPAPSRTAAPSFSDFDSFGAAAPKQAPRISYAAPASAPSRPQSQPQPQYQPQPQPHYQPQPQSYAPAPRPAPRPVQTSQVRGGGILDQLSKDYALPSGSTPLHDISFGYY